MVPFWLSACCPGVGIWLDVGTLLLLQKEALSTQTQAEAGDFFLQLVANIPIFGVFQ